MSISVATSLANRFSNILVAIIVLYVFPSLFLFLRSRGMVGNWCKLTGLSAVDFTEEAWTLAWMLNMTRKHKVGSVHMLFDMLHHVWHNVSYMDMDLFLKVPSILRLAVFCLLNFYDIICVCGLHCLAKFDSWGSESCALFCSALVATFYYVLNIWKCHIFPFSFR